MIEVVNDSSRETNLERPRPFHLGLAGPTRLRASGQPHRAPSLARRFRTIQARPKDLSILIWQVERVGDPAGKREGHAMGEKTIDQRQSRISDTQAMALYSEVAPVV
jgi:hypothetical protein